MMNSFLKLRRPHKLKGFTLLEMLIVLTIIGTLSAIIVPNTVQTIRDSKIEAANTMAKEAYIAVQNYLTQAQTKRIPLVSTTNNDNDFPALPAKKEFSHGNKKRQVLCFYGALCPEYANLSDSSKVSAGGSKSSASAGELWGVDTTFNTGKANYYTGNDFTNPNGDGLCDRTISGISDFLGASNNASTTGAFYVILDVDTYTVLSAYYSEQTTALDDVIAVGNSVAKTDTCLFYSKSFGGVSGSGKSQQIDTNDALGKKQGSYAYVGQYPIAGK